MGIIPTHSKYSEAELIEQQAIPGRKALLRQFIKNLHLCQTGQGKGIYLTGNEGAGKTALLNKFLELAESNYQCCAVSVTFPKNATPEEFFAHTVEAILNKAYRVLDNTLIQANACTEYFGLEWNHQDLIRTVALVHMQESMQGRRQFSVEALTQSIFGAVPFFKRMDANLKPKIQELAKVLSDPWVTMAVSLINPINTQVQQAVQMVQLIRGAGDGVDTKGMVGTSASPISILGQSRATAKALPGDTAKPRLQTADMNDAAETPEPGINTEEDEIPEAEWENTPEVEEGITPKHLQDALVDLIQFINNGLNGMNNAFILSYDHWEALQQTKPEHREAIKDFMSEVLRKTIEQRNVRIMMIISCQSEAESYAVGESLFNAMRTKFLMAALPDKIQQQVLKDQLKELGLQCDEDVLQAMSTLCNGNPAWGEVLLKVIATDSVMRGRKHLDMDTWQERFAVNQAADLLDILFTRMQMPFMGKEASFETIMRRLIHTGIKEPFSEKDCLKQVALHPDTHSLLRPVLESLIQYGFVEEVATSKGESRYRFYKPFMLTHLRNTLRPLQEEMPTEDKIASLKRILPLTVAAGELTRDKTQELLAMARVMETPDLIHFMEDTLVDVLSRSDLPLAHQMTLLESLTLMKTQRSIDSLLMHLQHDQEQIREFTCQQMMDLVRKKPLPVPTKTLVDRIMPLKDDPAKKVQYQVFQFLALVPEHRKEIEPLFLAAMDSSDTTLQLLAINGLQQMGNRSRGVLQALSQIIERNSNPLLAKAALRSLAHFPAQDINPILSKILNQSLDHPLWKEAFMLLMQQDLGQALPWIRQTLEHTNDSELRLFLLKRLGSSQNATSESILRETLDSADRSGKPLLPEERWIAIRSLGWIGNHPETLNVLERQMPNCQDDDILNHSLVTAIKQVRSRVDTTPESRPRSPRIETAVVEERSGSDTITPEVIDEVMHDYRSLEAVANNGGSSN